MDDRVGVVEPEVLGLCCDGEAEVCVFGLLMCVPPEVGCFDFVPELSGAELTDGVSVRV